MNKQKKNIQMGIGLNGDCTETEDTSGITSPYVYSKNISDILFPSDKNKSTAIRLLAIDQASNCGWCTAHASGVWNFNTRKDESAGMKLLRFRAKLKEVCELEQINLIAYERVAGFHKNAIIHASKMVAIIESFCEENNIDYKAVSATEVKKFATGKGNAGKQEMIASAKLKLGYEGNSDDEADALWIYQLLKDELGF